jgi:hypothetical protein
MQINGIRTFLIVAACICGLSLPSCKKCYTCSDRDTCHYCFKNNDTTKLCGTSWFQQHEVDFYISKGYVCNYEGYSIASFETCGETDRQFYEAYGLKCNPSKK